MPSPAANKYLVLSSAASRTLEISREQSDQERLRTLYGAAFVTEVAGWNAYTSELINSFFTTVASPLDAHFHAMHSLASAAAKMKLDRFNTPNAENTRNLILQCTGYDPWPDWSLPARGMTALAVRERLNEVLKVRHSLAHGFAMPAYTWTQSPAGLVRLTRSSVEWTRSFIGNLVAATDRGLRQYVLTVYGLQVAW